MRAYLKEFLGNFGLGVGIFSLFFFFGESSKLFEMALLVAGANGIIFLRSLGYLYGQYWMSVTFFVVPMSLLLGVILTNARLQEDREFLAMESVGVDIQRWTMGFLMILGAVFCASLYPLVHQIGPQSRLHIKQFAFHGRNPSDNLRVEPKTWLDLEHTQLFAEEVHGPALRNVVLYSNQQRKESQAPGSEDSPYKVTGKNAVYRIIAEAPQEGRPARVQLFLRIFPGTLEYPDLSRPGHVTACSFSSYENYIPINTDQMPQPGIREKSSAQLRAKMKNSKDDRLELESRHSLAFSPLFLCFACGLVSFAMGRRSKGFGFGLALALLGLYWISFVLFSSVQQPWAINWAFTAAGLVIFQTLKRY